MLTFLLLMCLPPDPPKPATKAPIMLRDQQGRVTGTFTQAAENYVLRDAQGRIQGSVTLRGNQATIKNSRGRVAATGGKKK